MSANSQRLEKTLVEPYFLAHGHRLPCALRATSVPMIQAALPPPCPVLTEADPRPPGQPQEQAPVDGPHTEVGIKPQLSSRVRATKEEDGKCSISCTSCRLSPHDQLCRLWVSGMYKRTIMYPQKKTLQLWKLWTWEVSTCRSSARLESELSLQQVPTPALPSTGGPPREVEVDCSSQWGQGH